MTEDTSKTGDILDKPTKPGVFKKGYDPRRNLRGVPKDTIKGRALIRKIGAELIRIGDKDGDYEITRAEAMIRLMYSSKAHADKKALIDALWPGLHYIGWGEDHVECYLSRKEEVRRCSMILFCQFRTPSNNYS
jgi:hypothetical protein